MRPPVIIGAVVAVLIVVAALVLPVWRSSTPLSTYAARAQATAAQTDLARVSLTPAAPAPTSAPAEALAQAAAAAAEQLQEIGNRTGKLARESQARAHAAGVPSQPLPPLATDAAGIQRLIEQLDRSAAENEKLLRDGSAAAEKAVQANAEAVGVGQSLGAAQQMLAVLRWQDAQRLRTEQTLAQARLLDTAAHASAAAGLATHSQNLDVAPTIAQLRTQLEELTAARATADGHAAALRHEVQQRQAAVATAETAATQAQQALNAIDAQGFKLGDDAAFDVYARQRRAAVETMRTAQAELDLLRDGGLRGATLRDDDLLAGKFTGGERVVSLDALQRELARFEDTARRYAGSRTELEERIASLTRLDQRAKEDAGRHAARAAELRTQADALLAKVITLATQAAEKEDAALSALSAAIRAYGQAQRAAEAWVRSAQEVQRTQDPERQNERLKAVISSDYLTQFANSAEAAARLLAGRIDVLRADSLRKLLDDLRVYAEYRPDATVDTAPYTALLEKAQTEGTETLDQAIKIFERLARGPTATAWIPKFSQAVAQYAIGQLDPAQYGTRRTDALALADEALNGREKFPYARELLPFRAHLTEAATGKAAPGAGTPSPEGTPASQPSEEEDFFK